MRKRHDFVRHLSFSESLNPTVRFGIFFYPLGQLDRPNGNCPFIGDSFQRVRNFAYLWSLMLWAGYREKIMPCEAIYKLKLIIDPITTWVTPVIPIRVVFTRMSLESNSLVLRVTAIGPLAWKLRANQSTPILHIFRCFKSAAVFSYLLSTLDCLWQEW